MPIVLQQCWPQTPWAWRRVTLLLSPVCDVIVPDLPSFAYSSMSENGFDKKTITLRLRKFLQALGPPASCSPATIWVGTQPTPHTGWKKPSFGQKEAMDVSKGGSWHFGLNMAGNTSEELERGREFLFVDQFIRREKVGLFDPYLVSLADIKHYASAFARPGALRSSYSYYRTLPIDREDNHACGQIPLSMPMLAIGAEWGYGAESA